jgi:REP element-mobilizing transposase RayT
MKKKVDYKPLFVPNTYYHCYNHAVGDEQLFREKENYSYFLDLYKKYVAPISMTYAYCLMPNHYHFLIRIASVEQLKSRYLELKPKAVIDWETMDWHRFITRQLGNFFNAYAKAINKRFSRRGALFEDDVKRPRIDTEAYFLTTLRYIHQNPIHHGFVDGLEDWDFTSYPAYLSTLKTGWYKTEVLNRFGSLQAFCEFHQDFRILPEFDEMY